MFPQRVAHLGHIGELADADTFRRPTPPTPTSTEPTDEADPAALSRVQSFWEHDGVQEQEADGEGGRQLVASEERPEERRHLALTLDDDKPLRLLHPDAFFTSMRSAEREQFDIRREKQEEKAPLVPTANASWRRPRDVSPPPEPSLLRPTALRPGERPSKMAKHVHSAPASTTKPTEPPSPAKLAALDGPRPLIELGLCGGCAVGERTPATERLSNSCVCRLSNCVCKKTWAELLETPFGQRLTFCAAD